VIYVGVVDRFSGFLYTLLDVIFLFDLCVSWYSQKTDMNPVQRLLLTKSVSPCRTQFHFQALISIRGIFTVTHFTVLYLPFRVLKFENRDMEYINFTPFSHLCKIAKSDY